VGKELERKNTRSRSVRDFVAVTDRARHCWTTRDASFGAGSRDARPRARLPARAASTPAGSRAARGRTPRDRRRRCVLNRDTSPYTTAAKEPAVRSIVSAPRGAGGRARPLDRSTARPRDRARVGSSRSRPDASRGARGVRGLAAPPAPGLRRHLERGVSLGSSQGDEKTRQPARRAPAPPTWRFAPESSRRPADSPSPPAHSRVPPLRFPLADQAGGERGRPPAPSPPPRALAPTKPGCSSS
jgi:hypothetical protein